MAQFARPDSDVDAGAWTYSTGATLFGCIDETSYDEADYIQLNNSAGSTCELGLSNVTDPASSTGHIIRVRARKVGTGTITCTAYLFQGATQKATFSVTVGTSFATTEYTLTSGEADSISDYNDLRLKFTGVCNAAARYILVAWAEFEVPAAASGNYDDAVSLAKSAGISESGPLTMAGALSVARQAGVSEAGVGTFPAALNLGRSDSVSDAGYWNLAGGVDLSRLAGFDLTDTLIWEWTHIPQRALTRLAYPRYAFPVGNPGIIYLGLVLSRLAEVSADSTQSADLSIVLGMSDGLSVVGGMDLDGSIALSRVAGIAESLTRDLQATFSLAKYAGVAEDVIRQINPAVALSKTLGLTEGLTISLSGLVTLSRLDAIVEASQINGQAAIVLAEKLYIAQTGNLITNETLSLGELLGLDGRGGFTFEGALTLAHVLGLSDASALALQKILEEMVGIRLMLDTPSGIRLIDAETAGILQDLLETGGILRTQSDPAGVVLVHADEVEI